MCRCLGFEASAENEPGPLNFTNLLDVLSLLERDGWRKCLPAGESRNIFTFSAEFRRKRRKRGTQVYGAYRLSGVGQPHRSEPVS